MTPTTQSNFIDMIMQRLGMGAPDGSVPGGPPPAAPDMGPRAVPPMLQFAEDRSQFMPQASQPQQPGSLALNPIAMPTQAPPGLQVPTDGPVPFGVPPMGETKTPAALPQMGEAYTPPAPQREAVMTQDADRGSVPTAPPAARRAPESGFLSNAAQFVSGMRTGGLITDLAGGYKAVENRNATREFLTQKGLAPETISAMEADPRIFQPVMADLFSSKTQVINNKLVESRTGRVIADFSDTATKGPDVKDFWRPDGSRVSGVWNAKTGRHELPDGQPLPTAVADTAGVPPGVDPKKYRETLATKMAEDAVKARVDLPEAMRNADFLLRQIDNVMGNAKDGRPYEEVVGPWDGLTPNILPAARDAQAKINQLKGQTFLQAYQSLKGTGAISNTEGAKAEAAMARLQDQRVDQADYGKALEEFRQEVVNLREIARRKAAGNYQPLDGPASASPSSAAGNIEEGRTATGQDGSKVIYRGGKWVPFNG